MTPTPTSPDDRQAPSRKRFRPHERLRQRTDFQRVFARKRAVSDPCFVVHAVENNRDHARIGIAIPKKIARSSVQRHHLKRLVREVFRLNKDRFAPGCDFVVVARSGDFSFALAQESLRRLAPDAARRLGRPQTPPTPSTP